MSRLSSEQRQLLDLFDKYRIYMLDATRREEFHKDLFALIKSQQQAWGDMVIDTHITPSNYRTGLSGIRALRKAQRQRNLSSNTKGGENDG